MGASSRNPVDPEGLTSGKISQNHRKWQACTIAFWRRRTPNTVQSGLAPASGMRSQRCSGSNLEGRRGRRKGEKKAAECEGEEEGGEKKDIRGVFMLYT